jgi:glycosyltransferase involved in cell wall biosynthesis
MINKKLIIAWICHFTNKEVQDILKSKKRINEMAPWIPSLAMLFESRDDIDLHIVAPHIHIKSIRQFTLRNVHYHFFNPNIYFYRWNLLDLFDFNLRTEFIFNKLIIRYFIITIKPDLIHLHGAENAYYSSSVFQFKDKYPVLVTLQGFLHKVVGKNCNRILKKRVDCELKIYKTFNHFGIRTVTMGKVVQEINPNAVLHWHGYVMKEILQKKNIVTDKKYDLVFFARIDKIKGIEDLLQAVSIIKKLKEEISALIIGSASTDYLIKLKGLCKTLGIDKNITWAGFLPTQADVHDAASKAKICVLPVQYEMISGTIIESMLLKIPVVAYNVGSIHEVNGKEEVISLVEKDNLDELTQAILILLKDEKLYAERADRGYNRALEILDSSNVLDDLLKAYKEVIDDFK